MAETPWEGRIQSVLPRCCFRLGVKKAELSVPLFALLSCLKGLMSNRVIWKANMENGSTAVWRKYLDDLFSPSYNSSSVCVAGTLSELFLPKFKWHHILLDIALHPNIKHKDRKSHFNFLSDVGAKEWKFDLEVSVAVCVISEFYHCQSRNQKGPFRVSLAVALLLVRDSLRRTRQMHSQELEINFQRSGSNGRKGDLDSEGSYVWCESGSTWILELVWELYLAKRT